MTRLAPKPSTINRLLALSGNQCAFPDCVTPLILDDSFLGILAHICAAEPLGPRFDTSMTNEERRSFENLLYMCPTHSMLIDKSAQVHKYSVKRLREIKHQHEVRYADHPYLVTFELLDEASDAIAINIQQTNTLNGTGTQNNNQTFNYFGGTAADAAEAMEEIASTIQKPVQPKSAQKNDSEDNNPENHDKSDGDTITLQEPNTPAGDSGNLVDNELGSLDKVALAEEALPLWAKTIDDISQQIKIVDNMMRSTTQKINADPKSRSSIGARLAILKGLAKDLMAPASHIESLGLQYQQQVYRIDNGLRETIKLLAEEVVRSNNNLALEAANDLYITINDVSSKSNESHKALEGFANSMRSIESMSKELRKPLQIIRNGLSYLDTRTLMSEWIKLIDESRNHLTSNGSTQPLELADK